MTGSGAGQTGEDEIIARYFRPLAKHPAAFGLIDDCAALLVLPAAISCSRPTPSWVACISSLTILPTRSPRRPCG
jgi:hypothetical protein